MVLRGVADASSISSTHPLNDGNRPSYRSSDSFPDDNNRLMRLGRRFPVADAVACAAIGVAVAEPVLVVVVAWIFSSTVVVGVIPTAAVLDEDDFNGLLKFMMFK